jgi:DNA-binding LytR/AlgR family response regulator
VHVTFNLTAVLLRQIDDYLLNGATDGALELTRRPAEKLTKAQVEEVLSTFFDADWHNQVYVHPRYRELFEQRTAVNERNQLVNLLAELRGSGEIEAGDSNSVNDVPNWLPIRNGRETVRVPVEAIEWVDAAGDYLCIHASGHTHILRATMREMENLLDPRLFQRVHRSTIVNLTRVKSLRAHMNGEYFLRLEGGQELKLSRTYRDKVEYFLKRPRAH